MDGRESNSSFYHITPLYFFTLSSLFCQLSSRLTINSMQWDKVERIPAVVALKVMASPLKSIPFIPLGLAGGNTGTDGDKEWALSTCQIEIWISGYKRRTNNEQVFYQIQIKKKKRHLQIDSHFSLLPLLLWLCSPSVLGAVRNSSSSSSTISANNKTKATKNKLRF